MTEYYRKLDAVAQSRYLEKLKLFGLEEKDDPHKTSNSCNFIHDTTKWPSVENGRIFCYYIQCLGSTLDRVDRVDAVEELGSLQLIRQWQCEADQGLAFVRL